MLRLIGLIKPLVFYMFIAVIMGVVGNLCASFITIFGSFAVLDVLKIDSGISIKSVFICLCVFAVIRGILRYAEQACNHYIAFKLLALIREKVFKALRKLCPAKLDGKDKGNLISIITSDIELLEVFYAHTISPVIIAFFYCLIMCLFISRYSWILSFVALCAYISVGVVIPIITSKINGDDGLNFRTKSGELSAFVLDSLRGLSEILQYSQGNKRLVQMENKTDLLLNDEKRLKNTASVSKAVCDSVILLFDFLMLFVSSILCISGKINFSSVIIPTIALMSSFGPVIALSNLASTLQNTFAAGNRVLDILDEKPQTEEISNKKDIVFTGANAKNVTFSYSDETVLENVSVEIPNGKIVAIAGKSGSGKSTLLKLFMRFWDVNSGSIDISGEDIKNINTASLRKVQSLVTQETHLFCDSIKNNLRIAKLDATDEEIENACKMASVHDFIVSLPNGYETNVGELGDTLSSGEKQRIGLARAFLHNSDLILLDEPTSNLDSLNEALVLKSLKEKKQNKTVVIISHRKSSLCIAEKSYCVEHGRLS